jgi:hypothetical protein
MVLFTEVYLTTKHEIQVAMFMSMAGLDGFSCIAFPMFPKYCKFLVDIVDYLM